MSKYSQLPRDTLALLAMRAQKGMDIRDYVNWAVIALADGFDSPSLAILAGLDYGVISQIEASEYFLRAVKELNLPIPDSELAWGDWSWADALYRKLGLTLPDEATLVYQHLYELAEQIRDGAIDPVTGLERIYSEILVIYRYGLQEYDGIDLWKWDELRDSVYYDENYKKRNDPSQKKQEITAFATQWLNNSKSGTVPAGRRLNRILPIHHTEKTEIPIDNIAFRSQEQIRPAEVIRKIPDIIIDGSYFRVKKQVFCNVLGAIGYSGFTLFMGYGFSLVVFNFFSKGEKISILTLLLAPLTIFILGIASVTMIATAWHDILGLVKRFAWIRKAVSVQLLILDRKTKYNYKKAEWECEFKLEFPMDAQKPSATQIVKAEIPIDIYREYEKQGSILVYQSQSDPCCFLIKGE